MFSLDLTWRWGLLGASALLVAGVLGVVVVSVSAQSPELVNVPSQIQVGQTRHVQVRGVTGTATIATSSTAVIRFESCATASPVSSIQRQNDGLLSLTACTAGTSSITLAVDGATVATYAVQATAGGASGAQSLPGPRLSTPIRVDATTALLTWTSVNGATGYKVEWFRNDSWDTATNLANVNTNTAQMVWVGTAPEYVRVQSLPNGGYSNTVAMPPLGEEAPTGDCPFGYVLDPIGKRCVWIREPVPERPPTPTPGPGTPTAVPTPTLTPVPCVVNIDGPTVMRSGVNVFYGVTFTGEDMASSTWLTWTLPVGMRADSLTVNQSQITVHWNSPLAISTGEIRVDMDCAGGGTTNATKNVESHPHTLFDIDAPVAPRNLQASTNETQTTITLTWVPGEVTHQLSEYEVYWDYVGSGGSKDEVLLLTTGNPRLVSAPAACPGDSASMCVTVDVSDFLVRRFHTFRVKTRVGDSLSAASNTAGALAGPERVGSGDMTGMCPEGYAIDAVANRCIPAPTPTPVPDACELVIDGPANVRMGQRVTYQAYYQGESRADLTWLTWAAPMEMTVVGLTRNAETIQVIATEAAIGVILSATMNCATGGTLQAQQTVTIVNPTEAAAGCELVIDGPDTLAVRQEGTYRAYVRGEDRAELTWLSWVTPSEMTEVGFTRNEENIRVIAAAAGMDLAVSATMECANGGTQTAQHTTTITADGTVPDPDPDTPTTPSFALLAVVNQAVVAFGTEARPAGTVVSLLWDVEPGATYEATWFRIGAGGEKVEVSLLETGMPRLRGQAASCTAVSGRGAGCRQFDVSYLPDARWHTFRVYAVVNGMRTERYGEASALVSPSPDDPWYDPEHPNPTAVVIFPTLGPAPPPPRWLTAETKPDTLQSVITLTWAGHELLGPRDYQVEWLQTLPGLVDPRFVLVRDTGFPRLLAHPAQCAGGAPGSLCVDVDVSGFITAGYQTFQVRAYKNGQASEPSPTASAYGQPLPENLDYPVVLVATSNDTRDTVILSWNAVVGHDPDDAWSRYLVEWQYSESLWLPIGADPTTIVASGDTPTRTPLPPTLSPMDIPLATPIPGDPARPTPTPLPSDTGRQPELVDGGIKQVDAMGMPTIGAPVRVSVSYFPDTGTQVFRVRGINNGIISDEHSEEAGAFAAPISVALNPNPKNIDYTLNGRYDVAVDGMPAWLWPPYLLARPIGALSVLRSGSLTGLECPGPPEGWVSLGDRDEGAVGDQGSLVVCDSSEAPIRVAVLDKNGREWAHYDVALPDYVEMVPDPERDIGVAPPPDVQKDEIGLTIVVSAVCEAAELSCNAELIANALVFVIAVATGLVPMGRMAYRRQVAAGEMAVGLLLFVFVLFAGSLWVGFPIWIIGSLIFGLMAAAGLGLYTKLQNVRA